MQKQKWFKSLLLILPITSLMLSACASVDPYEQKYGYKENDPESVIVIDSDNSSDDFDFIKEYYDNYLPPVAADFKMLYQKFPQIDQDETLDLRIFKNLIAITGVGYALYDIWFNQLSSQEQIKETEKNVKKSKTRGTNYFEGATKISKYKKILLPESLVVQSGFTGMMFEEMPVPKNVKFLGGSRGIGIKTLNFQVPSSVQKIGSFGLNDFTSLRIPSSVKKIGVSAFYKSKITSLELLEGIKKIDGDAFKDNEINTIIIPNSVTEIVEGAFDENPLFEVRLGREAEKTMFQKYYPQAPGKMDSFFSSPNNFMDVYLPNSFKGWSELNNIFKLYYSSKYSETQTSVSKKGICYKFYDDLESNKHECYDYKGEEIKNKADENTNKDTADN